VKPLSIFLKIPDSILVDHFPDIKQVSSKPLDFNATNEQIQFATPSQLNLYKNLSESANQRVQKEILRRQLLLKVKCLKNFLVDEGEVSIVRFGKILDIFGPLDTELLDRMFGFMSEKWFHGDMTKEEAYELLSDKPIGQYLVRFSSTTSAFVISVVKSGRKVVHLRVKHTPEEGFSIPGSSPEKDMRTLLVKNKAVFIAPQPPPASKFDYLTTVPTNSSGGYYTPTGEDTEVEW